MDIILCHTTADFDTLGAAVGLSCLLPGSRIVLAGGAHPTVRNFLALHWDAYPLMERRSVSPRHITGIHVVDAQRRSRLGKTAEWLDLPQVQHIHVYDHHGCDRPNPDFSAADRPGSDLPGSDRPCDSDIPAHHWHIAPVGAATTLIVEALQHHHPQGTIVLNPMQATVMALGIHADTGSLTFDHSTPRDGAALAWLMAQGATIALIGEYISPGFPPALQELLPLALQSLQTHTHHGHSLGVVHLNLGEFLPGLSSLASQLMELTDSSALLLAVDYPSKGDDRRGVIIGRSAIEGTDLHQLFQPWGGGGHPKAASLSLHGSHLRDLLGQLTEQLLGQIPPPLMARELMSAPVRTIRPTTAIAEAQRILLRYGHSGLSVVDEWGSLVGIISRRDLDLALHHGLGHAPVKGYMATQPKTITPDTPLPAIEDLMVTYDIGRLPVVEEGALVGIVTRTDVLRQRHQQTFPHRLPHPHPACPWATAPQEFLRSRLVPALWELLQTAAQAAESRGWHLYLVGGAVRDLLLAEGMLPGESSLQNNSLQNNLSQGNLSGNTPLQNNLSQNSISQGNLSQGNLSQGNLLGNSPSQDNLSQDSIPQDSIPQDNLSQGDSLQSNLFQGDLSGNSPSQDNLSQGNLSGNSRLQDNLSQDSIPQGNLSQGNLSEGSLSGNSRLQDNLLQDSIPQGNLSQGNLSGNSRSQDNSLQDNLSQDNFPVDFPSGDRSLKNTSLQDFPTPNPLPTPANPDYAPPLPPLLLSDIDLVVDGYHASLTQSAGVELARALQPLYPQARLEIHGRFQTAALLWHQDPVLGSLWVDIATARTEFYPYPAANPEVESSSIQQDLYRRDFTINALALRLTTPRPGLLLDFFGGLLDLQERQVRVLHANSFIEDPTRIYRAVRFAVRLGFELEPQTRNYMAYALDSGVYERTQGENPIAPALQSRLRSELQYILSAPYWLRALDLLGDLQALRCIHGSLWLTPELRRRVRLLDRYLSWVQRHPPDPTARPLIPWLLRLEGLLTGLDPHLRSPIAQKLQLPAETLDRLDRLETIRETLATQLPALQRPSQIYHLLCPWDGATLGLVAVQLPRSLRRPIWHHLTHWLPLSPPLGGEDLKALGYKPGRQFKVMLDRVFTAALDGELTGDAGGESDSPQDNLRQRAIDLVRREFPLIPPSHTPTHPQTLSP